MRSTCGRRRAAGAWPCSSCDGSPNLPSGPVVASRGIRRRPPLPDYQATKCPAGHHNCGVAHGVPGVIGLLGQMCASGLEEAIPLLEGAVAWLLDRELGPDQASVFPEWIAPGDSPRLARLAWCYGDAGIAATMLVAARGAKRADWEREALRIARRAVDRPRESTGVVDAGLCHGAAGLAHVFNRMYQATGEAWLADAARNWFTNALDLRRRDEGIAGFVAMEPDAERRERWVADPGFLMGTAGIGLALLSASTSIEPEWDRLLLTAIPRAHNGTP